MSKYGSSKFGAFLVGGYSLLASKVKNVSRKVEATQEASHGLGDSWEESTPTGMRKGSFSQDGAFFDDNTNSIHAAYKDAGQTARVGCIAHTGNVIGQNFFGFEGLFTLTYEVLAQLNNLTKANPTYTVSGKVEEGVILQEWEAKIGDWNTAATSETVDGTAASSAGGAGYLQVSAMTGFPTFIGRIKHSSDNGVADPWTTLVTFANTLAAPDGQRVVVAGTVKRYLMFDGEVFGDLSTSPSASASPSASKSPSASVSPSVSPSSSKSPSASASVSPSASKSPSASASASVSASVSPSASASPSASTSSTPSASKSPSASVSPSVSASVSPSVSASISPSVGAGGSVTVFAGFVRF